MEGANGSARGFYIWMCVFGGRVCNWKVVSYRSFRVSCLISVLSLKIQADWTTDSRCVLKETNFQFERRYPAKVSIFLLTHFEDTFHCHVHNWAVPLCVKGRSCRPFIQKPDCNVGNSEDIPSGDECLQLYKVFRERCMQFVAYWGGREANQWSLGDECSVPTGPRSS